MATTTDEFMREMIGTTKHYCIVRLKAGSHRNQPAVEKIIVPTRRA